MDVRPQMFRQVTDTITQDRDLDFGRSGIFLMPGIIVLTAGSFRMNLKAVSAIEEPLGINGRNASALSTLCLKLSGEK